MLGGVWADFARPLDGLVIITALHFQHMKEGVIPMLRGYLRPTRRFLAHFYSAGSW